MAVELLEDPRKITMEVVSDSDGPWRLVGPYD